MSLVNGPCDLVHTLLSGDGAQGRARVEVVEAEAQEAAAAELIHQQGPALLKHIWGATKPEEARQGEPLRKQRTGFAGGRPAASDEPSLGDPQFIR